MSKAFGYSHYSSVDVRQSQMCHNASLNELNIHRVTMYMIVTTGAHFTHMVYF